MSPRENRLFLLLRELCRNPQRRIELVEAFGEEALLAEEDAVALAKAALFDPSLHAKACAAHGRAQYLADVVDTLKRMKGVADA